VTAIRHTIIGLPRSGKTTFLAAMWHLIDAGEVDTVLVLDRLAGDSTHLNEIALAWRRCEEVQHTSIASEANVSIHFLHSSSGMKIVLEFPDLDGESFSWQVEKRTCPTAYVERFGSDGGILLFLTADRGLDGITIIDLAPAVEGDEPQAAVKHKEWEPGMVPQQVRLVELLQFLQMPPFRRVLRRVAVVISAWDVVQAPQPSPDEWLKREMPLLHQFLEGNAGSFDFRVYGVSAQGGPLTGASRDALLKRVASERITCVGLDARPHDLTSIVLWLTQER